MRTNAELGKVMYPNSAKPPEVAAAAPITDRAAAANVMYGASKSGHVRSIDNAVASCFDRLADPLRDDKERLAEMQHSQRTTKSLLEKADAPPAVAHQVLSPYLEHRTHQRSEEAIMKQWNERGSNQLRSDAGSTEKALQQLAAVETVVQIVKKNDPVLAQDLVRTGTTTDPRFIQGSATIVENLKQQQASNG